LFQDFYISSVSLFSPCHFFFFPPRGRVQFINSYTL
jgi:hypothetical protein